MITYEDVDVQYHEVIGALTGRVGHFLTYFFNIFTLCMVSIIQLIASARWEITLSLCTVIKTFRNRPQELKLSHNFKLDSSLRNQDIASAKNVKRVMFAGVLVHLEIDLWEISLILLMLKFGGCCSNLYYANSSLDKRQWQYIVGGVAFLAVLVPDFGHFRSGAFIGVVTTTITSVYLLIAALSYGQVWENVFHSRDAEEHYC